MLFPRCSLSVFPSLSVSLSLLPCLPPSLSCSLCLAAVPKPRHYVCLSCVGSVLKSAVPLPVCSFPMTASPQTLFMLSRFASSLPFPLWVQSSGLLSICESLCWLSAVWWLNVDCGDSRTRVVFAWTSTVHLEPQQPPRVNRGNPSLPPIPVRTHRVAQQFSYFLQEFPTHS